MDDILAEGERLRQRSQYTRALTLFKRSLKGTRGKERIIRLMAIGDTYRMTGDFLKAEKYYAEALELGRKIKDLVLKTDASVGLGLSRRALGGWKTALSLLTGAEKTYIRRNDREGIAFTLWAKAGALRIKGDIPEAVKTFKSALKAFIALKDDHGVGYCLCGLGGTTRVMGLNTQSLRYYSQANELFQDLRVSFGIAYSHCGIGNALRMSGQFESAKSHFRKAIRIYRRIGDIVSYSYTLWSMGKTYMIQGKYALSEKYFNNALKHFRKTRDPRGIIYCKLGLAELRALKGKTESAGRMLVSLSREAGEMGFMVEKCHADELFSSLTHKGGMGCYNRLGLRLKFKSIPFNIP